MDVQESWSMDVQDCMVRPVALIGIFVWKGQSHEQGIEQLVRWSRAHETSLESLIVGASDNRFRSGCGGHGLHLGAVAVGATFLLWYLFRFLRGKATWCWSDPDAGRGIFAAVHHPLHVGMLHILFVGRSSGTF